ARSKRSAKWVCTGSGTTAIIALTCSSFGMHHCRRSSPKVFSKLSGFLPSVRSFWPAGHGVRPAKCLCEALHGPSGSVPVFWVLAGDGNSELLFLDGLVIGDNALRG